MSNVAAGVVMATASVVVLVWGIEEYTPFGVLPQVLEMSPLGALMFLAAGASLCQVAKAKSAQARWQTKPISVALAGAVTLVGALKLLDHIGQLLGWVAEAPQSWADTAPNTAAGFLCCGLAILLLDVELKPGIRPAQWLALASGIIALIALLGYSYQVSTLYSMGTKDQMSLSTAVCFALLSLGLLATRPNQGIMHVVTSRTTGGAMARRLLPMALFVPWLLGILLLRGEQLGYYPRQFALAMFGATSIVVFTGLIWWNARLLYSADLDRARSERRLAAQHASTKVLAEASSVGSAIPKLLQVVCESLDWDAGVFWAIGRDGKGLRAAETWQRHDGEIDDLIGQRRGKSLVKGEEIPGRVWQALEPAWLSDGDKQPQPGNSGEKRASCAFPVVIGKEFFGVLEFYGSRAEPRDEALVEMLGSLGTQLGLFVERIRAEEQVRQTSANLQRSNTELQQFAHVASHDLFEPLRMVTSYLQLLQHRSRNQLDSQANQFIELAIDGAKRMNALIHDLLLYSRVDARGRSLEPTDCGKVFEAAVANLKVAIEESGAMISSGPLPTVMADSVQLTQVFQNLIGNAIKFRGAEPPQIVVRAEANGREWRFAIQDNGIGIEPKHFERIFVLFQRLHTRQEYAGTGMGLAICKKIIQRHGGNIWVESTPGAGSTFYFTLPVMEPERQ